MDINYLEEICGNCGFTFGSHHGGTSPYPYNYCPGNEGRMDWDKGPGTCFSPTGIHKNDDNQPLHPTIKSSGDTKAVRSG